METKVEYPEKNWFPEDIASSRDSVFIIANSKLWFFRNNKFNLIDDSAENGYLFSNSTGIYFHKQNDIYRILHGKLVYKEKTDKKRRTRFFNGWDFQPAIIENRLVLKCNSDPSMKSIILPVRENALTSYSDKNNNLWLLSGNTFYNIKYAGYFKLLAGNLLLEKPLKGVVKDISGIYIADNKTVYTPDSKVRIADGKLTTIFKLDKRILVIKNDGIFQLENNKLQPIITRPVSYVAKYKDKLFFVSKGVLYSFRYSNNTASVKEIFNLKTDSISKISFDRTGNLLLLDKKNRIFILKAREKGFSLETLYSGFSRNAPQLDNIFKIDNEIYVSNPFNVFKLHGNKLVNQEKSSLNFPSRGHFIEYLAEDTTGGILYSTGKPGENKHFYYGKYDSNSTVNWLEIPVWEAGLNNPSILGCSGREVVFYENGKLIHLDLDNFLQQQNKIVITTREVTVENKPVSIQSRKKGKDVFPYFEDRYPVNVITLKFHASDLTYPEHIKYSFLLKDKEEKWSPWAGLPEKNFSNLPPVNISFW